LLAQQLNAIRQSPHQAASQFKANIPKWLKEIDHGAQCYSAPSQLPAPFTSTFGQELSAQYDEQRKNRTASENSEATIGEHIAVIQGKLDELVCNYTDANAVGNWTAGKNCVKNFAGRFFGHVTVGTDVDQALIETVGAENIRDHVDVIIYDRSFSNQKKFQEILVVLFKRMVIFIESCPRQGATIMEILTTNPKDHLVVRGIAKLLAEIQQRVTSNDPDWSRAQAQAVQCFKQCAGQAGMDLLQQVIASSLPAARLRR